MMVSAIVQLRQNVRKPINWRYVHWQCRNMRAKRALTDAGLGRGDLMFVKGVGCVPVLSLDERTFWYGTQAGMSQAHYADAKVAAMFPK